MVCLKLLEKMNHRHFSKDLKKGKWTNMYKIINMSASHFECLVYSSSFWFHFPDNLNIARK